jgi:hypothetical protein
MFGVHGAIPRARGPATVNGDASSRFSSGLTREEAMRLLGELQALDDRLRRFRTGLEHVLAEDKGC